MDRGRGAAITEMAIARNTMNETKKGEATVETGKEAFKRAKPDMTVPTILKLSKAATQPTKAPDEND